MTEQANDLYLPEDLGIAAVAALHEELRARVDAGQATRLVAAEVGRVDGAGLQLLAAFARECERRGQPLAWDGPSEALHRAARLLGLESVLHLPAQTS
jgi:ABC-type transporter Mla MlaB component